jgi:hypothetical protein
MEIKRLAISAISIIALLVLMAGSAMAGPITTGNFEDGTVGAWKSNGPAANNPYIITGANVYEGQYAMAWNKTGGYAIVYENVSTLGWNNFSMMLKTPSSSNGYSYPFLMFTYYGNGSSFAGPLMTTVYPANQYFKSITLQAMPQVADCRLTVAWVSGPSSGIVYVDDIRVNGIRIGPAPLRNLGVSGTVLDEQGQPVSPVAVVLYDQFNSLIYSSESSSYAYDVPFQHRIDSGTIKVMVGAQGYYNSEYVLSYPGNFTYPGAGGYMYADAKTVTLRRDNSTPAPTVAASAVPTLYPRPTLSPPTAAPVPTIAPWPTYPTGSLNPYEYLDYIGQLLANLVNWLLSIPGYLISEIGSRLDNLGDFIGDLISWVGSSLSLLLEWLGATFVDSINELIQTISDIKDSILLKLQDIADALSEGVGAPVADLIDIIFYPVWRFSQIPIGLIGHIVNTFTSFFNHIKQVIGIATDTIINVFTVVFYNAWVTVIGLGIGIVVCLRVYWFIKDLEVFGTKV